MVAVVATAAMVVVVVVVGGVVTGEMVDGVLEGIYSGLHCFSPESTAQYFIHKRLRY